MARSESVAEVVVVEALVNEKDSVGVSQTSSNGAP